MWLRGLNLEDRTGATARRMPRATPGVSPFDLTFNHETALFQVVTALFQIIVAQ
ncbi:hypothetical protein M2232_000416 [Bradyrhizobium japonicum]|nr:hypothetical protein [Bradyrhizobium japonicum]MCW2341500.1 hypothetical protein [Bradyrhizobium japonicum]